MAGSSGTSKIDFALARYNPDGSLDRYVVVSDEELAAGGHYAGANATDVFSAAGNLVAFTHGGKLRLVVPTNTFADVDPGDELAYSDSLGNGGALPVWLRFNAATRTFTSQASNLDLIPLTIKLTVHDNQNASVSSTFTLSVNENHTVLGNASDNVLYGTLGNDVIYGRRGSDALHGRSGDDTYVVDNTGDVVRSSVTYTLPANVENLTLTGTAAINGTGNGLNNRLIGNSAANVLNGDAGDDTLIGELGADRFKYLSVADSRVTAALRDVIQDFSSAQGDKIDLSALDANSAVAGDQAFVRFAQGAAFSGVFAAQASVFFDQTAHILYGNNDADIEADFSIQLAGVNSLVLTDFTA